MERNKTRLAGLLAGLLVFAGMAAGIFSVVPAIDGANFLTEAAANTGQVLMAAIFQLTMALAYAGFAILLYPAIKRFGSSLSVGFLSFRIIAVSLVIVGAIVMLSILALSQEVARNASQNQADFEVLGNMLRITRDYINHVFMILVLCAGNMMFYVLLLRSKLIPRWLSAWGLLGNLLSIAASLLVLFQAVGIITTEYLALNAVTAMQEVVLGIWLVVKGFNKHAGKGVDVNAA